MRMKFTSSSGFFDDDACVRTELRNSSILPEGFKVITGCKKENKKEFVVTKTAEISKKCGFTSVITCSAFSVAVPCKLVRAEGRCARGMRGCAAGSREAGDRFSSISSERGFFRSLTQFQKS